MRIAFFATRASWAPPPRATGWANKLRGVSTATPRESSWAGSEELWWEAARVALERGHQVAVVCFRWPGVGLPPKTRQLRERGALVLQLSPPSLWNHSAFRRWLHKLELERFRVWGALASWRPDAVCVSQGGTYDTIFNGIFENFLKNHDFPFTIVCQWNSEEMELRHEAARRIGSGFFSRARHIAFVSERNLRVAERQIAGDLPNACVVRNPVNLPDLESVPYPKSDVIRMANVARHDVKCKGQDVLLQALSDEIWRRRRWLLRFYGSGGDRSYLERLVEYYDLADRVEFRGHVSDIRSIWADNHLLVMSSRSEGTPLALVEAMICGRPSVVTDVGGNLEWVDEPSTGFVAEAPSERSLNNALERAWEARDHWEAIGQRARQTALSKVDPHPGETLLSLLLRTASDGAHDRIAAGTTTG